MVLVACRKEIPLGVRCRTLVNGSGLCSEHAKSENVGGFCRAPDAVEFVLSVNPGWRSRFESAGLSAEPHYAGPRIDYLSEALALGVDPYYYGEAPTSGTAVFDVKGTTNVSIEEAWTEIQALRYDLTRLRLVRRSDSSQRMTDFYATFAIRRLQATVHQTNPLFRGKVFAVAEQLVKGCWGTLRVWVNPPRDGCVTHAVVVSQRNAPGPASVLNFEEGLWGIR